MNDGAKYADPNTETLLDLITEPQEHDELCPNIGRGMDDGTCGICAYIRPARADERAKVLAKLRMGKAVDNDTVRLTSRPTDTQAAAASKAVLKAGTRRKEVFDLIVRYDGLTDDEIETITRTTHQSASATRNSLMRDGYVWDSGERRANRQGNLSIVWKEAK